MIETFSILGYILAYGTIYVAGLVGSGVFINWARKSTTNVPISGLPKREQRFLLSMVWPISIPVFMVWIVIYNIVTGIWYLYCYCE